MDQFSSDSFFPTTTTLITTPNGPQFSYADEVKTKPLPQGFANCQHHSYKDNFLVSILLTTSRYFIQTTMESATDTTQRQPDTANTSNKRVHIASALSTRTPTSASDSPLAKAKLCANVTIASLPVTIKSLAEHYVFEYLQLKTSVARLETIKLNLANDSFIPRSARIKFAIGASTRAQEAFPTEFEHLQTAVETTVSVPAYL
jgi:hypothetical protein